MLTRFRALPLALSALLALSSCLPCYTLAYADEGAEVIADGQQDDRAAGSGDEFEEGSAQPAPYNEAGEGAAAGETEAEDISEVPSGSSPGSGGAAGAGLDGASEDAYLYRSGTSRLPLSRSDNYQLGVIGFVQEKTQALRFDGSGSATANANGQYAFDGADAESAASGIGDNEEGQGEEGASPTTDGGLAHSDDASPSDEGIAPYAVQFSVIDTLMGSAWSGEGTQFVIGSNKISAKNGTIIWAVLAAADVLEYISDQIKAVDANVVGALNYIQNQLRSISTNNQSYVNSIVGLSQNQWGYWIGDTYIVKKNSPAEKLSALLDITNYLSDQIKAVDANVVGALNYIQNQLRSISTNNQSYVNSIVGLSQNQWGYWIGDTYIVKKNSPAEKLAALLDITNYLSAQLKTVGGTVSYISEQIKSVASLMPQGSDVSYMRAQLKSIGDYLVANGGLLEDIYLSLESNTGISRLLAEWADRWDTQDRMMVEWGKAWEAYRDSVLSALGDGLSLDVSGIESRLDDIKNLLLLAGTKDIIDAILGDLDDMASAALLGEVQAAAQNAFPFCIPFVVKQLLGLVESDPAAPEFDFVIGGETMHVDLAFAQGFVDILGWACRFLLVFGLVVSSRRFIYTGAVS
ncbi:hypothetical protein GKZ27_00390 [Enterorhabdus mucosicola]|uniref:Uncharacterized protein n=1 Tax=Adlercreutzia mucosicola TaxID=580026 RepID=A0A6N8JLK6_9ACTN|nr:hypothetical protein [Adlercreutzia mucosicola]MVX59937.1 hypothetical protein [Adlercreutzia mucosicola]